jgi:methyl-accepting chemotaxis protein
MSDASPDVDATVGAELDADVEQNIDRQEGYDHETASEIQTSIAELQGSSEESADEADDQTEQIEDLVAEL